MHVKRYLAATLSEAIAQVKAELGPDALVLSTRQVRRDGGLFGWLGRPMVEVVAAVDRERRRREAGRCTNGTQDDAPAVVEPHPSWQPLALTQALLDPLEAELRALRCELEARRPERSLEGELVELRRAIEALRAPQPAAGTDPLTERLLAAGLALRHARALVEAAGGAEPNDPRAALPAVLRERLDARLALPRDDDPAPVSLLVGAPGVGKTTTVVKLAARAGGRGQVALLTTDVHRAGGCEALRAFAASHGIAFATAASPEELVKRIERLGGRRILVDTDGCSRSDTAGLALLQRARAALGERARVHLVVSATTQEEDLRDELRRFEPLAPDALIATHTDDTERLAPLGNLLLDERTPPLAWLGVGRRVPDDLALPEPGALAERLLGVAA